MKVLELKALEFAACVKPGDRIAWGQAGAEPLALTRALMAQRAAIGRFSAFIGITWSDMVNPDHADHVRFTSYCGAGHNRRLAKAGLLDVLPCHYSQLPDMIRTGRLKIDVLMLQVAGWLTATSLRIDPLVAKLVTPAATQPDKRIIKE
jgi:acyl-CoA hydrolase